MQQATSETQAAVGVIVEAGSRQPIYNRKPARQNCEQASDDAFARRLCQNTQCFMCSRIYFGQRLRKCPHCNSESVHHYATVDLNLFARDTVRLAMNGE
jgi:hypothetical protein